MRFIADLHIHSRFSRACSKEINIANLERYARLKGIGLLGTGDFTHPKWLDELKRLEEREGILYTESGFPFIWQSELSLMYTQGGKGRRVHHVILAPGREEVEQFNTLLAKRGRLDYDGRPIFGFSSIELIDMLRSVSERFIVIPAHIWTPYFGVLGSKSGFDSIQACFAERTKYIYAIETGLSSDPPMNWRLSSLDSFAITSASDMHSFWPWRLGREATVFDIDNNIDKLSYDAIFKAFKTKQGIVGTIEVDPSYGKYHFDGHRNCKVSMAPQEALSNKNICPRCKRPFTLGVLHRVEELADRPADFKPENRPGFKSLLPLSEIIAAIQGSGMATRGVWQQYYRLTAKLGSELAVLVDADEEQLKPLADQPLVDAILANRAGKIDIIPGYDGEYGRVVIGDITEEDNKESKEEPEIPRTGQKSLGEFW